MHIAQWQSWVMFKTLPFTAFCCIWDKTHVISADRLKMKQIFSYLVIVTQCPAYLFSPSVSCLQALFVPLFIPLLHLLVGGIII